MDDHKHCPFCGAPAEEGKEPPHWVRCSHQCEAGDRWMHPNAWNRRKIKDALRAEIAVKDEQIAKLSESLHHARQLAQSAHEAAELAWGGAIPSPLPGHRRQTEEEYAAEMARLNCPLCGGSGHVDDADQAVVSKIKGLEAEITSLKQHRDAASRDHKSVEKVLRDLYGWEETASIDTTETLPEVMRRLIEVDKAHIATLEVELHGTGNILKRMDVDKAGPWGVLVEIAYLQKLEAKVQRLEAVRVAAKIFYETWEQGQDGFMGSIPIAEALEEALQAVPSDEPATGYAIAVNETGSDEQ